MRGQRHALKLWKLILRELLSKYFPVGGCKKTSGMMFMLTSIGPRPTFWGCNFKVTIPATHATAITNRQRLAITTSKSQDFPIAVSQSQNLHWGKKSLRFGITPLESQWFPGGFLTYAMFLKHDKNQATGGSRVQGVGFRGCFLSRSDFFELRLQSPAICDFEVAAIRVTKVAMFSGRQARARTSKMGKKV